MARLKFLCDSDRCIECNACVTACKNEHDVPWGINRRRVVTLNDGRKFNATVHSLDRASDVALVQVMKLPAGTKLPTITIGSSG